MIITLALFLVAQEPAPADRLTDAELRAVKAADAKGIKTLGSMTAKVMEALALDDRLIARRIEGVFPENSTYVVDETCGEIPTTRKIWVPNCLPSVANRRVAFDLENAPRAGDFFTTTGGAVMASDRLALLFVVGARIVPAPAPIANQPPPKPIPMPKKITAAVGVIDASCVEEEGRITNRQVWIRLRLENKAPRRLIGTQVRVTITNPLGRTLLDRVFETDVPIDAQSNEHDLIAWGFEDNPYTHGQPYDLMAQVCRYGTAKIEAKITRAVFDDGAVLSAEIPRPKPSSMKVTP